MMLSESVISSLRRSVPVQPVTQPSHVRQTVLISHSASGTAHFVATQTPGFSPNASTPGTKKGRRNTQYGHRTREDEMNETVTEAVLVSSGHALITDAPADQSRLAPGRVCDTSCSYRSEQNEERHA